jgi:hypothetical protein
MSLATFSLLDVTRTSGFAVEPEPNGAVCSEVQ